ncbi:hypothetical protein [Wolbachia endosymbiont (group B) of Ablattaria laevigata]|uniref:hypothetical protein n=1 Tax=Wolbachia endosymbiont (group B) of Ablattaria laevigata TaxID=3077915 RepID=UPI00376F343E
MLGNLTNREHVFGSSKPAQYGKTHIHRNESKLNDFGSGQGVQSADTLHVAIENAKENGQVMVGGQQQSEITASGGVI